MGKLKPGIGRSAWLPWAVVILLAGSCCVLAVLQYRWITEFSAAERDRMRAELQSRLGLLAASFNSELSGACSALIPDGSEIEKLGREKAYGARYENWRKPLGPGAQAMWFKRVALAVPRRGDTGKSQLTLENLDFEKLQFKPYAWPGEWTAMRVRLEARINSAPGPGERNEAPDPRASTLMVIPRLGESPDDPGLREQEWLIVELDEDYVREAIFPVLLKRYLGDASGVAYDAEVTLNADPTKPIYRSAARENAVVSTADASVAIFSVQLRMPEPKMLERRPEPRRGPPPGPPLRRDRPDDFGRRGPPPDDFGPRSRGDGFGRPINPRGPPPRDDGDGRGSPERVQGPPPLRRPPPARPLAARRAVFNPAGDFAQNRWRLYVRHRQGSIEALAARARNRNFAASGGLLLLIAAIVGTLFQLSRQSQRLADLQMNFVAGVSHELRTPLTVIRTAAYNLRGKLARQPEQVEKYGRLIQEESEKLGALVEQVLQFASDQAGHVIREREPAEVATLIEESLQSNLESFEMRGIELEKRIDYGLPPVLADRLAIKRALQNLIENAMKYGTEGSQWIGVYASRVTSSKGPAVEIRIADRGPGIPAEEQDRVFDPFFRGRRAISNQVHGTGLGLSLVRRIVEAHGGTIEVRSGQDAATEFIVRLPAAPKELLHEFAHSLG